MDRCWAGYKAWIAYFDFLGFKQLLKNVCLEILQLRIDEVITDLEKEAAEYGENVDYLFYADTFTFYSRSNDRKHFPAVLHVATHFIEKCISKGVPLRGAISFGEIAVGHDKRILIGKGFLESHCYAEDADWVGLVLTPSATEEVIRIGLNPAALWFINRGIPLRKQPGHEVWAYTFCRGVTNFPCPLLGKLKEMQQNAPDEAQVKYEKTIKFIDEHYKVYKEFQPKTERMKI